MCETGYNRLMPIFSEKLPKEFGRKAFGDDPAGYHSARPNYPEWVYDTLIHRCGLRRGTAAFEIGPGTGIATSRLLALGADPLVAIEPDQRLARFLRANNPDRTLKVLVSPFENSVLNEAAFDLGFSATSFHWLNEELALKKIVRLLRPGGWWVAVWNVFGDDSRPDPFHEATIDLLAAPASPSAGDRGIPFALDSEVRLAALKRINAFDLVEHRQSRWDLTLNAEQTMALYATYSNVNARPDRSAVLAEIGRIVRDDFADRISRNMITTLYLGRRTCEPLRNVNA